MTFPSVQSALDYISDKVAEFFRQTPVLIARLNEVVKLKQEALKRGDQESAGKLIVLQTQVRQLLDDQVQLEIKLRPFADALGYTGLGVFPLILIPVAVGVASLLYLHFQKINAQRDALDLIKRGMLSPAQAETLLDSGLGFSNLMGGGIGMMLPYLVVGGGLYAYFILGWGKRA